ncbi:xanthine dehydrogenase [Cladophialophora carrionii CBS 160.54]|uniref:xanthine dehydrogenase n=1 Tax=Cladophialophora carrionii CBS 160.54 TaxID=1279043 RepID=V9DRX1_9EURO|nr:xanthine dehydrogenase [Cladophialophora carrionii CBS 160.54]ETI28697.1 xanthine dehydrogenase [Cladophialophora carrionii CBS 160.54]
MAPGVLEPAGTAEKVVSLASLTESYDDTLRFYLNGTKVELDAVDPELTLLEYLRGIGLTGTKLGCAEGGCGACTVVVSQLNPTTKKIYHASVNACLAPLASVDGKHVVTIEGIGNSKHPHPAQQRIAMASGSQCGFCTPGIVMSLYALLRNNGPGASEIEVEENFDGNLCRCTGYRPILDAAQSFNKSCGKSIANGGSGCCMDNGGSCNGATNSVNDVDAPEKKYTPPSFIHYDPSTELIYPPALRKHEFRPLAFGNKRKKWYRPVTLKQLLEIKNAHPAAKLIGGSTETQIEIKFKAAQYSASVYVGDIAELRQYSFHDDYVEIGGNVALTDLENICDEAVKHYGEAKAQSFKAIKKAIRYFAGRQIRNVGTPAGNLATASPISDLNPVFVATKSVMIAKSLKKTTEIPMGSFFKRYRVTALPEDAVIAAMRIPITAEKGEYVRSYKQSKRKDDDIAIVNACLRVALDDNYKVKNANLVYGGMAPITIEAKQASEYIVGKTFTDPQTLEGVMSALEHDFNLPFGVPGGMAWYRKSLALGFFYRFYQEVLIQIEDASKQADEEVVEEIEREISKGHKDHDASVAYSQKVLGKEHPHLAALKQCTGEAQYTDDIPTQKNELIGCLVLSTKAHAKLISVDPSPALQLPGVAAWVDRHDFPNPKANWWGAPVCDEVFFAEDEVFTAGQPIGMILANTPQQASAGARAVLVQYEELPAIYTIEEAIEKQNFFAHYRYIRRGDVDKAFQECDHVFEGTARMGGQEHFYLETNAALAIPKPEDGEMEIWSSTQNPSETQAYIAKALGVQSNKIVSKVKRLGGGFGGKETRSIQLSTICAVAANKVKRPVRCMLNRDEDIMTSGQRHPFLGIWKVGVNKDGKIQALRCNVFNNAGWCQDLSAAVVDRALSHIDGCYNIPNIDVDGRLCKTNTVSNTAFRGFGGPQGMFIAESYMEEISDHLKIPVDQLREINFYKDGEQTHFKQALEDWHVPLMYKQIKEESNYDARRKAVDEFNATHKWQKKGLAIIPTKFGISFTALFLNQAGALVHIYHDGSVLVAHGGTEMGQGLHTKICMIVAEALQVPLSDVHISETATNTVANSSSTAASASSDLNGYAAYNACMQINERLAPYREKFGPKATMHQLATAAYFDRVNLSANGFYKTPEIGYIWGPNPEDPTKENTGKMFFYFTQGVTASEVLIDTLTGDWTCLRSDIKMDVGRSINPAIDYGQIEGAYVQGQGLFTTEESLWHRASGQLFTRGPGAYKIPGFRDIPQIMNVSLLKDVEWKNLRTIQRSRGVGEPPLFMGSAVFFAIRDALKAARKQYGVEEVLSLRSPATPERIRISCADPILKRCAVEPREGEKSFFVSI